MKLVTETAAFSSRDLRQMLPVAVFRGVHDEEEEFQIVFGVLLVIVCFFPYNILLGINSETSDIPEELNVFFLPLNSLLTVYKLFINLPEQK